MNRLKSPSLVRFVALIFSLFPLSSFLFPLASTASAQGWPENYGGVMLQGFYWDSYKDSRWYILEQQAPDLAASFDLIWIPQSGNCGSQSMGYDDLWWFNDYNSSFGSEEQLRSMIQTFKGLGLGTIADVVINHRRNLSSWTDFPKETYNGETYEMTYQDICSDDEAAKNGYEVGPNKDTGEGWDGMRDLDHKSENVQRIVKAYLKFLLNDLGYTGFRYDMVKGYSASFTGLYNADATPQFSVGEYWDGYTPNVTAWIDGTKIDGSIRSAAFDFPFRYTVRNALRGSSSDSNSKNWKQDPDYKLLGSESLASKAAYRRYAVTFVENHDTEYRSASEQQDPIRKDTLAANAFLLAMPGTPCVFFKHWLAYGPEIKAMIAARKLAGITNMSEYARYSSPNISAYYATIVNDKLLCVVGDAARLTPEADQWTKILSGHHYAYYLANTMETAWVDKGSGIFKEPFDVELTAVSNTDDAQLVYTLDGTEPSATNGTQTLSGTLVRIDAGKDAVLKVALLVNGIVSGLVTRNFTYQEDIPEPEVVIPDFCTVTEGEVCAFFEAPSHWSNTVCCWAWVDKPAENFTYSQRKDWPGVDCVLLGKAANGNNVWKWTWDGTKQNNTAATQPEKIIFNNTGQPQTENLAFTQAGYYNVDGLQGTVTTTAIDYILCPTANAQSVHSLDGRLVRTDGSLNGLSKGIYIINGKKHIIK